MFDSICKGRIKKHFICAMKWESRACSCRQAASLSQIYTLILSVELIPFFTSQEKICFTLIHSNLCTIPTHFLCFQPHPSGKFLWEVNMGIGSELRLQIYLSVKFFVLLWQRDFTNNSNRSLITDKTQTLKTPTCKPFTFLVHLEHEIS